MSRCWRFSSRVEFCAAVDSLSPDLLGRARVEHGSSFTLALPEEAFEQDEELRDRLGGAGGEKLPGHPRTEEWPRLEDYWLRLRAEPASASDSDEFDAWGMADLLVYGDSGAGDAIDEVADALSLVHRSAPYYGRWQREGEQRYFFEVDGVDTEEWPRIPRRGWVLLYRVDPDCRVFLPESYEHPWPGLAAKLFPRESDKCLVWVHGRAGWEEWTRVGDRRPLARALVLNPAFSKPGPSRPGPTGDALPSLNVDVTLVPADETESGPAPSILEAVYRIEELGTVRSTLLCDYMDRAQVKEQDLISVHYYGAWKDPEAPHRGCYHYLTVRERSRWARAEWAEAYERPAVFRRHRLPIFIRRGWRLRPSLEALLQAFPDFETEIRKRFRAEDESHVVLVGPGPTPNRPEIERVPRGRPLEEVITPTFERWAPVIRIQAKEEVVPRVEAELEEFRESIQAAGEERYTALETEARKHFEQVDELAKAVDHDLEQSREHAAGVQRLAGTIEDLTKSAGSGWDRLVGDVVARHRDLIEQRHRWLGKIESELARRLEEARPIEEKAKRVHGQAKGRLETFDRKIADLEKLAQRSDELRRKFESLSEDWERRAKSARARVRGLREATEGVIGHLAGLIDRLDEERQRTEDRRQKVERGIASASERARQLERLQEELERSERARREKEREVQSLQKKVDDLRDRLESLPELEALDSRLKELQEEIPQLQRDVWFAEQRKEELEREKRRRQKVQGWLQPLTTKIESLKQHLKGSPSTEDLYTRIWEAVAHLAALLRDDAFLKAGRLGWIARRRVRNTGRVLAELAARYSSRSRGGWFRRFGRWLWALASGRRG